MKWIAHLPSAVCVIVTFSAARAAPENSRPVDGRECKEVTTRIIEETSAEFERFSPWGNNVFFKHPLSREMTLSCTIHRLTGVSVHWDNAFPSNQWFIFAATAGHAVTAVSANNLLPAIHQCHRQALSSESELAELDIRNAKIECQAFTRDGGGVSMSIWMNDHAARKGVEEK